MEVMFTMLVLTHNPIWIQSSLSPQNFLNKFYDHLWIDLYLHSLYLLLLEYLGFCFISACFLLQEKGPNLKPRASMILGKCSIADPHPQL